MKKSIKSVLTGIAITLLVGVCLLTAPTSVSASEKETTTEDSAKTIEKADKTLDITAMYERATYDKLDLSTPKVFFVTNKEVLTDHSFIDGVSVRQDSYFLHVQDASDASKTMVLQIDNALEHMLNNAPKKRIKNSKFQAINLYQSANGGYYTNDDELYARVFDASEAE